MKVLHVSAGNLYGGIETLLATLARERRACPHMEPEFALCFEGRIADELRREGATVHILGDVRARRPWSVWRARRVLDSTLAASKPRAVLTHGSWPHALAGAVARTRGARLVHWAHDRAGGPRWLQAWARRTPPDLVLANSHFTAKRTVFPGVPTTVLYYPASERRPSKSRAAVRAELGAEPEAVVILAASRLDPYKGHARLLDSLAGLEGPWQAWIAGGAQRASERALLAELEGRSRAHGLADRIRFLGQRSDVADLMAAADIFCQANVSPEPFGLVFVEALLAGVPVVTSALGGALEIVDATCGRLAPPDAPALRRELQALVADAALRRRLGAAGPERARALCSPAARLGDLAHHLAAA